MDTGTIVTGRCGLMEEKILVRGEGVKKEIIGESLNDCIETAYRIFKGRSVELVWTRQIGYIDGDDLYVDDKYLDRCSVKEIIKSGKGS